MCPLENQRADFWKSWLSDSINQSDSHGYSWLQHAKSLTASLATRKESQLALATTGRQLWLQLVHSHSGANTKCNAKACNGIPLQPISLIHSANIFPSPKLRIPPCVWASHSVFLPLNCAVSLVLLTLKHFAALCKDSHSQLFSLNPFLVTAWRASWICFLSSFPSRSRGSTWMCGLFLMDGIGQYFRVVGGQKL